ncbi:hypothetical protein CEXT_807151 [Caerostris extrusa]|uniref:Uncharacterized protein n=1 Tax=Caerostris extrusa TaxID=172846 RepID=A0AAV4Y660_CAEEX|nr:hypothetical protein CEXT_807151 [Caerostris extrusa]
MTASFVICSDIFALCAAFLRGFWIFGLFIRTISVPQKLETPGWKHHEKGFVYYDLFLHAKLTVTLASLNSRDAEGTEPSLLKNVVGNDNSLALRELLQFLRKEKNVFVFHQPSGKHCILFERQESHHDDCLIYYL